MLKDRVGRGFIAGLLAGVAMNLFSFLAIMMNWTHLPFWKWAAIVILAKENVGGPLEFSIGLFSHLFFTGLLGIVFSFLIPAVTSRIIIFKGVIYTTTVWFVLYGITHLFRFPGLVPVDGKTVLSNLAGSLVYGIALALAFSWLDKRTKISG